MGPKRVSGGFIVIESARAPPNTSVQPSSILFCQNLPAEVTEDVLAVLFQQYVLLITRTFAGVLSLIQFLLASRYPGFLGTKLSAADPTTKSKSGHVRYASTDEAAVALEALNGFQIKRGWKMGVSYASS